MNEQMGGGGANKKGFTNQLLKTWAEAVSWVPYIIGGGVGLFVFGNMFNLFANFAGFSSIEENIIPILLGSLGIAIPLFWVFGAFLKIPSSNLDSFRQAIVEFNNEGGKVFFNVLGLLGLTIILVTTSIMLINSWSIPGVVADLELVDWSLTLTLLSFIVIIGAGVIKFFEGVLFGIFLEGVYNYFSDTQETSEGLMIFFMGTLVIVSQIWFANRATNNFRDFVLGDTETSIQAEGNLENEEGYEQFEEFFDKVVGKQNAGGGGSSTRNDYE